MLGKEREESRNDGEKEDGDDRPGRRRENEWN